MTSKEMLHNLLVELNQRAEEGNLKLGLGICNNLNWGTLEEYPQSAKNDTWDLLNDLMRDWPEGTGWHGCPVPAAEGVLSTKVAYEVFVESPNLWDKDTWYGQQRRKLLAWLLEQTAEQTK